MVQSKLRCQELQKLLLQVKKVSRLQDAFGLFNRMMQTPGKAELTLTELRVSDSKQIQTAHLLTICTYTFREGPEFCCSCVYR